MACLHYTGTVDWKDIQSLTLSDWPFTSIRVGQIGQFAKPINSKVISILSLEEGFLKDPWSNLQQGWACSDF